VFVRDPRVSGHSPAILKSKVYAASLLTLIGGQRVAERPRPLSDIKLAKIGAFGPSMGLVLQSADYLFNNFDFKDSELLGKTKTEEILKRTQS
jgi:hypothetical protein